MATITIPDEVDAKVSTADENGKSYEGTFVLRTSLSSREESAIGRHRRSILGNMPAANDADLMDYLAAQNQAELCVRSIKLPDFWKNNGDDLPRRVVLACGEAAELAMVEVKELRKQLEATAQKQIRSATESAK